MKIGNICVFGDSIGKGVVLHPVTRRYEMIKTNIGKLFGQREVSVKNYSVFGCTVAKALTQIGRHAGELANSSVFLEIGGNDCDFSWKEIAADPEREHLPRTPLAEFKKLYRRAIEEIQGHGGNPIVLTLPPLEPKRFFAWVSRGIDGAKVLRWLGDVDMVYRWQELYNLEIMLLSGKIDVPLIDIRGAFLRHNRYGDLICADGIHPNDDGYGLIYRTIGEQYHF